METRHSCPSVERWHVEHVRFHVSFCFCMFWNFSDLQGDPYVWAWQDRTCNLIVIICVPVSTISIQTCLSSNEWMRLFSSSSEPTDQERHVVIGWHETPVPTSGAARQCCRGAVRYIILCDTIQRTEHGGRNGRNMFTYKDPIWQIHCKLICQTCELNEPWQIFRLCMSGVESRIAFRVGFGWGRGTSGTLSDSTKYGTV
jgi:hypothetical protein